MYDDGHLEYDVVDDVGDVDYDGHDQNETDEMYHEKYDRNEHCHWWRRDHVIHDVFVNYMVGHRSGLLLDHIGTDCHSKFPIEPY